MDLWIGSSAQKLSCPHLFLLVGGDNHVPGYLSSSVATILIGVIIAGFSLSELAAITWLV